MRPIKHDCDCDVNTNVIRLAPTIAQVKALKDRLIHARELRGLTQQELADLVGCSQSTIGNVEAGERHSLRNLIDIARALRVSPEWLYDGGGPLPQPGLQAQEPRKSYAGWPFSTPFERFDAMPAPMKALVDQALAAAVMASEAQYRDTPKPSDRKAG